MKDSQDAWLSFYTPNELHVAAMLTVLNQKIQPDPVITSSGCCQECPLTDLLHRWFCRGCIFASVNRRAEVSARKRSGRILCSLSAHVVRICFSPLSESERVSSPTRRVVNRVGGFGGASVRRNYDGQNKIWFSQLQQSFTELILSKLQLLFLFQQHFCQLIVFR